jgi:glutathione S-transferase
MSIAKLHYSPGSCAMAPHIALAETDVEYELIRVDLKGGEQRSPEFLAMNPLGRVPVLETPLGLLTEVSAILGYIASVAVLHRLIPDDDFDAAAMASFNS